jgi:hypothetical protein
MRLRSKSGAVLTLSATGLVAGCITVVGPPFAGAPLTLASTAQSVDCDGRFISTVTVTPVTATPQNVGLSGIPTANAASVSPTPTGFAFAGPGDQSTRYNGKLTDACQNGIFEAAATSSSAPNNTLFALNVDVPRQKLAATNFNPAAPQANAAGAFTFAVTFQCCAWAAPGAGGAINYAIAPRVSRNISGTPAINPAAIACPVGGGGPQIVTITGNLTDPSRPGKLGIGLANGCAQTIGIVPTPG